ARSGTIHVCLRRGEEEADGCADSPFAGDAYMTTDQPHEGRHLRQAQTGSSFPLCREEWIKDPSGHFWRHALTAVLALGSDIEPRRGRIGSHGSNRPTLRADLDSAALRQCIARIDYEVENR